MPADPRIWPGQDSQQQRSVGDSAPHRPGDAKHVGDIGKWPVGTRPGLGRSPTTLQKLAGLRSDPPRSLPSARATNRAASAAAAPPLLPPALRPRWYGLRVAPKTGLTVCEPAPNSGTLVFPRLIAPACAIRCTTARRAAARSSRTAASRRSCGPPQSQPGPCAPPAGRAAGRARGRGPSLRRRPRPGPGPRRKSG